MNKNQPWIDDALWNLIQPLIPIKRRRRRHPGRKPCDPKRCLVGIIYVLSSGIPWEYLPREFGCCGMTCWRRMRDWQKAGVWNAMHRLMLKHLHAAEKIDWSRAVVDSASVRAVGGAN